MLRMSMFSSRFGWDTISSHMLFAAANVCLLSECTPLAAGSEALRGQRCLKRASATIIFYFACFVQSAVKFCDKAFRLLPAVYQTILITELFVLGGRQRLPIHSKLLTHIEWAI